MLGAGQDTVHPSQILDSIKNEAVFSDFMQYLSMCGPLNMRLATPDKWAHLSEIASTDSTLKDKCLDLTFLDQLYMPKNEELGTFIEQIYDPKVTDDHLGFTTMQRSNISMSNPNLNITVRSNQNSKQFGASVADEVEPEKPKSEVPDYHSLKLCLMGKAQSGKKTQAQLLTEEYGDKLTIFNMEEIIREALSYVDPGAKEEAADPKAKGKGKPADAPSDAFAGLDTEQYKEIASNLLKQVQVATGAESVPGKHQSLLSLVSDDMLLVQLFIEKLKLTYPNPPPKKED